MQTPSDVRCYQARNNLYRGSRGPWLEHLVEDEGLTYEEAMEALKDWEIIPYIDEKRGHMATLIKRNREVHFAIYRRHRARGNVTTKRIKDFLQPLLEKNVFLDYWGDQLRFLAHRMAADVPGPAGDQHDAVPDPFLQSGRVELHRVAALVRGGVPTAMMTTSALGTARA